MPGISLADTIAQLNVEDEWGPEVTTSTTLEGVPYAPFSKGDKLGRMADWTQEGKEGRDRGQRYGRGYRGRKLGWKMEHMLTFYRPASLWRRHIFALRCAGGGRRVVFLSRRQYADVYEDESLRSWWRHSLQRPRSTRCSTARWTRWLPEGWPRPTTPRPESVLRSERWCTRQRRPEVRLERLRQATAEQRLLSHHSSWLVHEGRD